jgi:2-C-methyl-D-erythritol 4-phosphate cytidylyltransferase
VAEIPGEALVVLVHDAARPLLPEDVLERVLAPISEHWDGIVPGLPLSDTVKRVRDDAVVETVPREGLWTVQTPQAFPASSFREALAAGGEASDCAGLVEARGGQIKVVLGDPRLLKVTSREDLAQVEAWLT